VDTSILIALFRRDAQITQRLEKAVQIFAPSVALGELYFGALKSNRVEENLNRIAQFVSENVILICGIDTARFYGAIKHQLHLKGRPIPENDIWIAAIAREHQITLVTRDAHFNQVDDLAIEIW
jgi:tRNA(fMet)-specific endonuclease VapC